MQVHTNIPIRDYEVDSAAVAREIVAKGRIIGRVRRQLEAEEQARIRADQAGGPSDPAGRFRRAPAEDGSPSGASDPVLAV